MAQNVVGEGGQSGMGYPNLTGPRGVGKGFEFHVEQDGHHRRVASSNLIYLSVKGIKRQSRKTRKETSAEGDLCRNPAERGI